jgi:SNF2 family DNA or RNA helicase
MSILIKVKDNKIFLKIIKGSPAFRNILSSVKSFHCLYNPETYEWEISPKKFERVHEALSDIDRIIMSQEDEKEVDRILHLPSQIKKQNWGQIYFPGILKVKPIQGKSPYESFQIDDIKTLCETNRFGLFNEQGTGKSYILISTIELLRKHRGVKKVLFVTSSSGVYNIKKEFEKFSDIIPDKIAIGGIKNRRPFDNPDIDIILCNYRSFLLISDEYQKERNSNVKNYRSCPIPISNWLSGDQGILVLDESHFISNPKARQTKVLQLAAPFFEYRYIATGTPADIEWKWYSQLKILDPALVGDLSYNEWLEEYFNIGNRFSQYAINYIKPHKAESLAKIVSENCVRRLADDVLSLPEHFIRKYYVEFSDIQKNIYRNLVIDRMDFIQGAFGGLNSRAVINAFPYLVLAIDNPHLLLHHTEKLENQTILELLGRYKFEKDHPKVEALLDILESHKQDKVVVWTSHPSVGDKLLSILKEYNPLIINGESDVPKGMNLDQFKSKIVNDFQTKPEHRVLIAGIQVMNTSVTLVAANVQIVFDSTFNYTEYNQALARIHRIGQDKPVQTYILLIDESLDIARNKNLEGKDFINKKFLTKDYLDLKMVQDVFNMRGE